MGEHFHLTARSSGVIKKSTTMKTISNEEAIDLLSRTVDRFGGEFTYSGNAIMTQNQSLSSASKAKWQQLCRVETLRDAKAVVAAVQTRSVEP